MSQTVLLGAAAPLVLFVAKATLLLVAALGATITLRRGTAGSRHLVWLAALVGVLALPVLSKIPSLQIGILPTEWATASRAAEVDAPAIAGTSTAPRSNSYGSTLGARAGEAALDEASAAVTTLPAASTAPVAPTEMTGATPASTSLLETVAIGWSLVALTLVAWLVAGAMQVRRIVANSEELTSPDWTTPLCEVADRLDLEQPPRLVRSDRIEMAFACRALTPTVVLPAAAESWSDDRRRAVLLHELAHVKRHDLVGHTLGRVACALYWFHPLVWTAAKHLRAESEKACDDLVLSCGARPSEYAQHLLDMVTSVRAHGAPVMALPMARKKEFEGRMLAILDPAIRRASPGRAQSAAVIATLGVLSLTVAAVSPASAHPPRPAGTASPERSMEVVAQAPVLATPAAPSSVAGATAIADTNPVRSTRGDRDERSASDSVSMIAPRAIETITREATKFGMQVGAVTTRETLKAMTNGVAFGRAIPPGREVSDTGRITLLVKVLATDSDAQVRRAAAWALNEADTPAARAALVGALANDADSQVREMCAWALQQYGTDESANALATALLKDKSAKVRQTAAWALGQQGRRRDADALTSAVSDADPDVRESAIWALGQLDLRKAPTSLVNALSDNSAKVRSTVAWTLGQIGDTAATRALARAFETETDPVAKRTDLWAMAQIGTVPTDVIESAMKSSDPMTRREAIGLLTGSPSINPQPRPRPQPRIRP